jgi:histidine phosphotransferase ChpT
MGVALDLRVVELLCSRLCHDLVSPVGAINNGVELIEEMGAEMGNDALDLISRSGQQAATRLQLFRLSYGAAGSEPSVTAAMVKTALQAWFEGSKIRLDWQPGVLAAGVPGQAKLVINTALLGEEALPFGGVLHIVADPDALRIVAEGDRAALKPDARAALAGGVAVEELTPRTVQAFVTGRFAEHFGLALTVDDGPPGRVEFTLRS